MQKLFRITPPATPLLLPKTPKKNIINLLTFSSNFTPISGFSSKPLIVLQEFMSISSPSRNISTTSLHFGSCINDSVIVPSICSFSRPFYRGSFRCYMGPQKRPWVVLKGMQKGYRLGWFHSAAINGGSEENLVENGGEKVEEEEGEESEKNVKIQRKSRGNSGNNNNNGVCEIVGSPDLLTIPGVGPRNLRKLVDKGIGGVDDLKQIYRDKFFGKSSQKMVEYLQSSVGIIHRNHAESITTFIKKSVDEELKDSVSDSSANLNKNRITLCVEGNISVGKTTFLKRIVNETIELQDLVEVVPEPIDKWQSIGPEQFNILDAFYSDPQRYAYTFQNYVFVTRVMQERDSSGGIQPLRLMERSVFSDRMVFVRAVHEAKWMSEMEISIYDSWFDPVVSCLPGLIPDGFIYLRASPDTCHKRMISRKRDEEGGVSIDYLRDLHEKHESWLFPSESGNHGVVSVSKPSIILDPSTYPTIKERVCLLEGPQMHSSIQKVPALILDCENDIDFNRDIEAKRDYARQVAEFFEFVKKNKELQPPPKAGSEEARKSQVLLPGNDKLWVPGGKHFSESALQSLDFGKAVSLFAS